MNELAEIKGSYRQWALAALRALDKLGGVAAPIDVERVVRAMPDNPLTDFQWARVIKGKYLRWARIELKKVGFLAGKGEWELTPLGRAYLAAHPEPIAWPDVTPLEASAVGLIGAPLETVEVTDYAGYELPVLRVLTDGPRTKKSIVVQVIAGLEGHLIPGDRRILNSGHVVAEYRISWCLSNLKKAGLAKNPTTGTWEITDAGREQLEREGAGWDLAQFQDSKAKVRANWSDDAPDASTPRTSETAPLGPAWPTEAWKRLGAFVAPSVIAAFEERVRPDLGATPALERPLPRNVVLYGPPGTGKTYAARAIAEALCGEQEPSTEGPWNIVQFHPSYAYEDFVQGLRPALEHRELRYRVARGPFLQICAAAEKDPDRLFALVVDEINRGDPARIFGELLYALEYRGDAVELALGGQLRVPPNLVVIGTMNSVDRSVALVDYALRRRFCFVRVEPDAGAIERVHSADPAGARIAATVLETLNEWIVERLDRDHAVGHSFFLNPAFTTMNPQALDRIWVSDIKPLLEEYFFGREDLLREAAKVWSDAMQEASAADEEEEAS